jgi:uncharacterized RDD family membrane protein YckC
MKWYYADSGRQVGPVEEAQLDDLLRSGAVRDDTLVWREGMASWQPHSTARAAAKPVPIPAAAVPLSAETRYCSECGRPFPASEMVSIGAATVCAQCKPLFMQRVREGGQAIGTRRYAGFWIRVVALIIDTIILSVVGAIITLPIRLVLGFSAVTVAQSQDPQAVLAMLPALLGFVGISVLVNFILGVSYEAYFLSKKGGTIGKLALGLQVIRLDGSRLSAGQAAGRYFARILSAIILYIGFIMAGLDPEKRALHDRICNTLVIYSR